MLRDLKFFRRNSRTVDGNNENLSPDQAASSASQLDLDPSRPPFSTIQEFSQNPNKTDYRTHFRRKNAKIPPNCHSKESDQFFQFRTPDKLASGKNKSGLIHKAEEPRSTVSENKEDILPHGQCQLPPPPPFMASHPQNVWNAYGSATPRSFATGGKASSVHSGTNSTQSTPTKSVTKPLLKSGSRATRAMNFLLQTKGLPLSSAPTPGCASADVPHFELSEDPSFWMDHNVQVVVRVRPINSMEKSLYGYSRCIKQESAQNITWIGQSEARFVFDYVACETVNQEVLFRVAGLPMVENCMSGYNSCVFAYGQTGSGKTHTMLGEINDLEIKPSADRGMTPRIFEFLFARIKAEEESRRDEKLQYSCKCSFLEIYNEQITDLLNPSSTNLLIREDPQKGVHVENLTEIEVENVFDILKLLIHGAANRKVASTNMNHESSRSHSVFTCTIESRWEKDTTTTLRFARLNLVDLAGSERQKTSGAEGDRLKEASNINKSLSTLGHVIMILADMANGRQRHVPYRDSRLTFLLQDSLGGNSKTMIIANVSPSISSASETLCTLKFAQRAKTIQNNAIVNENASGDVLALQQQIHLLKAELSILKQQNVCRSLSFRTTSLENAEQDAYSPQKLLEIVPNIDQMHDNEELQSVRVSNKKLKLFESTLAGALRREKMADVAMRQLEAEIEQLNRLVRQRQEDTQCSKMMIKFREDKINRMEALLNGLIPSESYLREENNALSEEIKMLLAKVDRNPEVTRFALENMKLLERLRKFQDFYDEGERDFLLAELSDLRNQLVEIFDGKLDQKNYCKSDLSTTEHNSLQCCGTVEEEESLHSELKRVSLELDDCKSRLKSSLEINAKLTREINCLNIVLKNKHCSAIESNHFEHQDMDLCLAFSKEVPCSCSTKYADEVLNLELEVDILKAIVGEEKSSCAVAEERAINAESELSIANENLLHMNKREDITLEKLKDAKSIIEALESQQIISITELEELRENNSKLIYTLKEQEQEIAAMRKQLVLHIDLGNRKAVAHETLKKCNSESESSSPMQEKLKRMQASLEKAWNLNLRYQSDQASLSSNEREMDEVHRQVEAETAEVIVGLQEELATLNQLVDDCNKNEMLAKQRIMELENERKEQDGKLHLLTMEITGLSKLVEEKEQFKRSIMEEWELLAFEIADLLQNGNAQLDIANFEVASISDYFSHRSWISEQFGNVIKDISKRDSLIEELQKSLKDACNVRVDVECKVRTLRGALLAITEAQQQECSDKEGRIRYLKSLLAEKMSIISKLEDKVKDAETKVRKVVVGATIYFVTANRLFSINNAHLQSLEVNMKPRKSESAIMQERNYIIANEDNECKDPSARLVQNYQNANSLGRKQQSMQLGIHWENEEGNKTPSGTSCSFVEAKMKLKEFQVQMSTLKSCINEYTNPAETHIHGMHTPVNVNFNYKDWAGTEYIQNTNMDEQVDAEAVCDSKNLNNTWRPLPDYVFEREKTIENLKKEIKSALQSLEGVQSQMAEMFDEKELIKKSTLLIHESIKGLTAEVHQLHSKILNKEKEFEFKLLQTQEKLQMLEGNAMTFDCLWRKEKEKLELEISEVTSDAAHKAVEASNLLMKIEEAQGMMQDADIMVNELMEANKIAKLEINRHKEAEISLSHENCYLVSKIHNLQASLDEKDENLEGLQKEFKLNIIEVMDVVNAVESQFRTLKDAFIENFTLINHDLDELKSWIHQQFESRMWLEEIWLSIMGKDCAASALHLCHVGGLVEKITGLKAENCFIQNELSESNSLVATLKEQNINDKKELQMFNILKGKLLDINYSLAQITKKEHQTSKFSAKLCSFEKKILDLQHVEDTILERSNAIGAELDVLKNELNENNEKALRAAIQEESIRFNEQVEATNKRFEDLSLLLRQAEATNKTLRDEHDIESKEKVKVTERLEIELSNMNNLLNQNEHLLEVTQKQMNCIKHDKDNLESHVSTLNEKLIFVKEKEGIAAEKLENLSLENEEFKFQVMKMSKLLNEVQGKYEVIKKELNSMKTIVVERLKKELLDAYILLGQRDHLVEELQKDMSKIAREKHELESEVCTLKEMLKLTKPNSEKNEVLAIDAPQRKLLAENAQLRLQIEHIAGMLHELQDANQNLHDELEDKMIYSEILQKELLDLNTLLFKRNHTLQESQKEMAVVTNLKDQLGFQVSILKEQLEMAQSLADENEAIAIEARQIAEESKSYSQVKEEEVKMLERSVEELECTINALQEQVMIVKEEAQRQEQQRNVLELEKEAARNSNNLCKTIDSGHFELSRHLKETLTELKDAQQSIQLLQKEASEKEIEIAQCKAIISELNLHAEAQAREYKRKFKELEAMAFQVQSEFANPSAASLITSKSEKSTSKPRGSGSPFKCIGLGIVQQINTEKDEELTAARCKIEELEALAASRQKQIFMLNIRLAAAESMTHDVLRDLLGIKLDMTKYAKSNERSSSDDTDAVMEKDKEWRKLKMQVNEFVEERQSLLEEINEKHKELIAAQIRLEKIQEHEKLLNTENELLKVDNVKYKSIAMELEAALEKALKYTLP